MKKSLLFMVIGSFTVGSVMGCRLAGKDCGCEGNAGPRVSVFPSVFSEPTCKPSSPGMGESSPPPQATPPQVLSEPLRKMPRADSTPATLPVQPKIADPEPLLIRNKPETPAAKPPERTLPKVDIDQPRPKLPLKKLPPTLENQPQLPPISLKKAGTTEGVSEVREPSPEERAKGLATAQRQEMEKALEALSRKVAVQEPEKVLPASAPALLPPPRSPSPTQAAGAEFKQTAADGLTQRGPIDYQELRGKVYLWKNQWHLRFAGIDSIDRLGGTVQLMNSAWTASLREGQTIRVRGTLATAASGNGPAIYQIERLESAD